MTHLESLKEKHPSKNTKTHFVVNNVRFETMEEVIAILKNANGITRQDWIEYFDLFLKDDHAEYLKPYILFLTEEDLFKIIDETPAITKQEIIEKYSGEQKMIALYHLDNTNNHSYFDAEKYKQMFN